MLATPSNCAVMFCPKSSNAKTTSENPSAASRIGLRRWGRNSPLRRLATTPTRTIPWRVPRIAQATLVPGKLSMKLPANCSLIGAGATSPSSKIFSLKG
jgi:hypothetical protein